MSEEISKYELFNKYEESIELCELDYELFPDDNAHLLTAIEALQKQIPKKPLIFFNKDILYCPSCTENVNKDDWYCSQCGQKIDWSEVENE